MLLMRVCRYLEIRPTEEERGEVERSLNVIEKGGITFETRNLYLDMISGLSSPAGRKFEMHCTKPGREGLCVASNSEGPQGRTPQEGEGFQPLYRILGSGRAIDRCEDVEAPLSRPSGLIPLEDFLIGYIPRLPEHKK